MTKTKKSTVLVRVRKRKARASSPEDWPPRWTRAWAHAELKSSRALVKKYNGDMNWHHFWGHYQDVWIPALQQFLRTDEVPAQFQQTTDQGR